MKCHLEALGARLRSSEDGFTIVELLAATLVISLAIISLMTTFDNSRGLVSFSEAKETAVHVGERELEEIASLDYEAISYESSVPAACTTSCPATDPAHYVGPAGWYRWDQDPVGTEPNPAPACQASGTSATPITNCEELVLDEAPDPASNPPGLDGAVSPLPETVTTPAPSGNARITLRVQRFISWVDDDCARCPGGGSCPLCTGAHDYKRITVAVKVVGAEADGDRLRRGPRKPILVSTVVRG